MTNVYFSQEGMTSTTANYYANIAKEMQSAATEKLNGVRFYNIPINKLYLVEDARERPCEFYLKFEYTAEQAISRFGNKCSQTVKDCYANGRNPDKKFEYICYFCVFILGIHFYSS